MSRDPIIFTDRSQEAIRLDIERAAAAMRERWRQGKDASVPAAQLERLYEEYRAARCRDANGIRTPVARERAPYRRRNGHGGT